MNILVAHNFYKQPGGEDQCVSAEVAMLREYGHRVMQYSLSNDSIDAMGRVELAARTIWSGPTFSELRQLFQAHRPQIAHFHNTFPLISPSAYYAARAENVRVVQTLHNFRLCCVNALLFRDGKVCEDCLGKAVPWRGIVHRCYQNSYTASAGTAAMVAAHRVLGTWRNAVDMYIALSESSRRRLVAGGLSADKIVIKSNFADRDPGPGEGEGGYAIYVGRLSAEKGVETLLEAWRQLRAPPLKLVGDGPIEPAVREAAAHSTTIQWLRSVPHEAVYDLVGKAAFLVLPSRCYENFPRVVIEAFAKGTPVIASKLGAMAEIVEDDRTGLHFKPGDPVDLAEKVQRILADPLKLKRMRQAAREKFEQHFTAEANHKILMAIYERALSGQPRHESRG
jgi:glycosyltransferase involved in cell wall biosynthesis